MAKLDLARGFVADDLVVLGNRNGGDDLIAVYKNTFKGKSYVHLRVIYKDDNGKWNPGKGVSFDAANAAEVMANAGKVAQLFA